MLFLLLRRLGGHTLRRPDLAKLMASLLQNETRTDIPQRLVALRHRPIARSPMEPRSGWLVRPVPGHRATSSEGHRASSGNPPHRNLLSSMGSLGAPPTVGQAPEYPVGSSRIKKDGLAGKAAGEGSGSHRPSGSHGADGMTPRLARVLFQKRHAKADSRTPASP